MARRTKEEVVENDEAVAGTEEGAVATEEKPAKATKAAKPEGYVSPYDLAKVLKEQREVDIRPQVIYSYTRNKPKSKSGIEFPLEINTDGKQMVNVEAFLNWWDDRKTRAAKAEGEAESNGGDEAVAE